MDNDKWGKRAFFVAVVAAVLCLAQLAVGIASWLGWKPQPNWLSQTVFQVTTLQLIIAGFCCVAVIVTFYALYRVRAGSRKDLPDSKGKVGSLQQRTLALAQRLRQFMQKHGPRPTLMKADGESDADYIKRLIPKTQAWDDTITGDYYGFLFREIQQIRDELAEKGLTDSRLDDNFRIQRPKEENLRAIVEGLRFLASQLHE